MIEPPQHIWLVNLFFGVGVAPTGALLESLAAGLHRAGWRVEVLTGNVLYNRGSAALMRGGAGTVHVLATGSTQAAGFRGRLLSWLLFYLRVAWYAFTHRLPDQVLLMTTPPYLHLIFAVRNWFARRRAELILCNQDTYPEVLASVGVMRPSSPAYRVLLALQSWGVRRMNKVIVLDGAMRRILERHGARNVHVIPNWEIDIPESEFLENAELLDVIRQAKSQFRYLVLYTGNYGWGHDLTILFDHWRRHPHQWDFYFLFVGGGEKWPDLRQIAAKSQLGCVGVFPYVSKTQMPSLLRAADFGLVALERSCVGLMSPSKIHGYLACGKPLLYLGPSASNVAEAIETFRCGYRVDERDAAGLAKTLQDLAAGAADYQTLSRNALHAAAERYVERAAVLAFIRCLAP